MDSDDRSEPLCPDTELMLASVRRAFRLGAIARDSERRIWGLTARHVFDDAPDGSEITDRSGRLIAKFDRERGLSKLADDRAVSQIARFELDWHDVIKQRPSYAVTWPITAVAMADAGGLVVTAAGSDRRTGVIISSHAVVSAHLAADGAAIVIKDAAILAPDDAGVFGRGSAGALVLSQEGEAVGLALARTPAGESEDIVLAPLEPFLKESEMTLWAPPGSHWSDLDNKAAAFLRRTQDELYPDLGPRPYA